MTEDLVPTPARPEPATPEPATPEPATPEPARPEPARPEPTLPDRRTFLKSGARWAGGAAALLAAFEPAREVFASALSLAPAGRGTSGLPGVDEYLLDPGVRYLNHGSIGTIPKVVHEAHTAYLRLCETNPWLYMWDAPWRAPVEETRTRAARLLGCDPETVALTHNTTEGFNLLAQGLPLGPGDEVLFSSLNHPGAAIPWTVQSPRRGFSVRRFELPIEDIPSLSQDDVVALHLAQIRPETRVLVLPHVDNTVGLRHPVHTLAARAKAMGVRWVAVDGAQAVSMFPFRLEGSDIDFYSASPHKWVQSPKGVGLLYVTPAELDTVAPLWVSSGRASAAPSIRRFEDYGTRNLPEIVALGDALAFQETVSPVAREAHHLATWARVLDRVDATPGFRWHSPRDGSSAASLYLVETVGVPSATLFQRLWPEDGLVFRAFRTPTGIDGARLSPNLQTDPDDLETFFRRAEAARSNGGG